MKVKTTSGFIQRVILILRILKGHDSLSQLFTYLKKSKRYGPVIKDLITAYKNQDITYQELEEEVCRMLGLTFSRREKQELHNEVLKELMSLI